MTYLQSNYIIQASFVRHRCSEGSRQRTDAREFVSRIAGPQHHATELYAILGSQLIFSLKRFTMMMIYFKRNYNGKGI